MKNQKEIITQLKNKRHRFDCNCGEIIYGWRNALRHLEITNHKFMFLKEDLK